MNKHKHYEAPWLRYVMSCVLSVFVVALMIAVPGCAQKEAPPEPEIPAHFTTYTDEAALFSISYPPDWEPALSEIEGREQAMKELLESIESDAPVERLSLIFSAGVPAEAGYDPNVNILVEPLPRAMWSLDKVVEAAIRGIKDVIQDYHEFSRVKTTVGGKEAVIIDMEGDFPGAGRFRQLQMYMLLGKVVWGVGCLTTPEKFSDFEDDFHAIVRSLRIFK